MTIGSKPIDAKPPIVANPNGSEDPVPPSWRKIGLLAIGAAALLAIGYFSPLHQHLSHAGKINEQIRSFGPLAPLVLMLGISVLVAVGFPRLALCGIAGMALGFWSGLFWAQLGTLLGNYATFILARAGGREWAQRFLFRRGRLNATVQQRGVLGVFLARQVPLPGLVINLGCALLPIRHSDFLLGTIVGQLPLAIPCTLIGAGFLQPSFKKGITLIGLAIVASVLAWFCLRYALRRLGNASPGQMPPHSSS
jgi:uncharacterized membrane protein YdjX (TVP38/TMEM64 family)